VSRRLGVGGVVDGHSIAAVGHRSQVLLQTVARTAVNFDWLIACWQPTLSTTIIRSAYYKYLLTQKVAKHGQFSVGTNYWLASFCLRESELTFFRMKHELTVAYHDNNNDDNK